MLYRLPQLISATSDDPIFVSKARRMRIASIRWACSDNESGACGEVAEEYSTHFRDRIVVIIPDNDQVGRAHAEQVRRSIAVHA